MQRIDVLIVAALVVAGAASAIGVMTYEDDRATAFEIAWALQTTEVEAPEVGIAGGGGRVEPTIDVVQQNVTSIGFMVTITGDAARVQPTSVLVEVISPTNNTTSVEDELPAGPTSSIEVPVEVLLASIPDATTITGPSLDAARVALNATLSSSLGMGTWTIRVTFAPSAPGPLGGVESYDVAVLAAIEHYEGTLSLVGPGVGR